MKISNGEDIHYKERKLIAKYLTINLIRRTK